MTDIATMNEVVREEIRKQQARRRAETERARTVEASRDRLLARRLAALNKRLNRKPNALRRLVGRLAASWAMAYAVLLYWPTMLLNWLEVKGYIERVDAI